MKTHRRQSEQGSGMIWAVLLLVVVSTFSASLFGLSLWESRNVAMEAGRTQALYLAEAGIDRKLNEVRLGDSNSISPTALGGGTYEVNYDTNTKTMTATGMYDNIERTIITQINNNQISSILAAIHGNYNLSVNGTISIDGRDHDIAGNIVGPGTYGVSTSGSFDLGGSAVVGGNGIAPDRPAPPGTYQEYADPLPATPEEILGLQPGDLDAFKTTTPPTLPMQGGIVYMTSNEGDPVWNGPDFGDESNPSWGILIFHNTDVTAELRNLHGSFYGIVITDKLIHINGDAVLRGSTFVLDGNTNIGNGSAIVQYSTQAIDNATTFLAKIASWDDTLNEAVHYN